MPDNAAPTTYAYLVMRTDLPSLGVGKSRAQSMHAGNQLTWKLVVKPMMRGETPDPAVMAWHQEGDGFGTAIALGAGREVNEATVTALVNAAGKLGLAAGRVIDETYPYLVDAEIGQLIADHVHSAPPVKMGEKWRCFREEVICAWLIGKKEELNVLLARFSLTPDA